MTDSPASVTATRLAMRTGLIFLYRLVGLAAGVVTALLLARHYGPETYGSIAFAFAFAELFEVLAVLGTTIVITRELVLLKGAAVEDFWKNALVLRSLLIAMAIISAWAAAWIFFRQPRTTLIMLLWASLGLVTSIRAAYQAVLRARERATWSACANLGRAAIFMLLVVMVVSRSADELRVIQASLVATFAALVCDRQMARRFLVSGGHATWAGVISLLSRSIPLALSAILTIIQVRIDILMLKIMSGDVAVGLYSAATRLTEAAYVAPAALGIVVFPALTRDFARSHDEAVLAALAQLLSADGEAPALAGFPARRAQLPSLRAAWSSGAPRGWPPPPTGLPGQTLFPERELEAQGPQPACWTSWAEGPPQTRPPCERRRPRRSWPLRASPPRPGATWREG